MVDESENTIQPSNAIELQQAFFDNQSDCDYVRYEKEMRQRQYLIQNIAFALYGSPSEDGDLLGDSTSVLLRGYTVRQTERVTDVYKKICEQTKYSVNGEDVVMTVILVVCVAPKTKGFFKNLLPTNPGDWVDLHRSRDAALWCTAVFKIRKCIPLNGTEKPCKIFIDGDARVYSDWQSYLEHNQQPKCLIVVPTDGIYSCEDETTNKDDYRVQLSVVPSPALGLKAVALRTGDATSTVVGLGSVGVLGAAMFTPLAPVAITVAVAGSLGSAAYTTFRSGLHIHDRKVHEQSISFGNSEARMSWLTIGASVVSVSAGVAAQVLARSAAAGANMASSMGRFLLSSVDLLSGMNLLTGAAGVLNGLIFIIEKFAKYGETPSGLELFQFTMSTLFFLNAAMSKRTAMSIVEESQASTINTYRDTLRSNRHRKAFDKVSAETRRVNGHAMGNSEVITAIKVINNKDQFFADILKINKDANSYKMRMSLTRDGQVNLNQLHKFDPSQLSGMGKSGRSELFSSIGPTTNTTPNVPVRLQPGQISTFSVQEDTESEPMINIRPGDVIRIGEFFIRFTSSSAHDIADIMNNVTPDIRSALETIAYNVIAKLIPSEVRQLKLLNPDNDLLTEVIRFVFKWIKLNSTIDNTSGGGHNLILDLVKQFFLDGHVKPGSIMLLKEELMAWLRDEVRESRNSTICSVCNCVSFAKVL